MRTNLNLHLHDKIFITEDLCTDSKQAKLAQIPLYNKMKKEYQTVNFIGKKLVYSNPINTAASPLNCCVDLPLPSPLQLTPSQPIPHNHVIIIMLMFNNQQAAYPPYHHVAPTQHAAVSPRHGYRHPSSCISNSNCS